MIHSIFVGPRSLLSNCNHIATAIFWRSAITPQDDPRRLSVQLDHVLHMYHLGYLRGHHSSFIREPRVESTPSITVVYRPLVEAHTKLCGDDWPAFESVLHP